MPIATDGKGNWVTLDDSSGAWVPTSPPSQQQKGGGELGYAAAPPEPPPPPHPSAQTFDDYGREVKTPAETPGIPVVGGNAPGYRQSDILPIARREDVINDPNSRWYEGWAVAPGPLRALGQTPAGNTTIDPNTGTMNIAPEALAAATALGGVGGLRFGGVGGQVPRNQMLRLPPPERPPSPPAAPSPPDVIPMPAPRPWYETAYDRGGQPPAPAFEPQVTMRQPEPPPPPPGDLAPGVSTHELAPGGTSGPREAAPGGPPVNRSMPGGPDGPPAAVQPTPGSVGAAGTPTSSAAISTPDALVARAVAEKQKLLEQQQPGVPDLNQYVKDSNPTVAQIEQTVHASREDKMLRNLNTDVSQEAREVADRNNTARQTHYAENAGSEYDVLAATQARDAQLNTDIASAFRNKGTADAQPVAKLGQSILDGPDGKIDPVVRVVNNVMDKLHDKAGNLETDPAMLWGVRKQINQLLSKEAAIENPTNAAAARQLMQLRDAVDAAIEPAAPGFRAALKSYSDASRPIDAMELLQGREAKLYDSQNRMQYSKVQQMMKEAVAARHPDAPLNPWQSLSDDQMQKLWALRDDLRRSASAEDLARASGSDSVPNALDVAKQYAGVGISSLPILGPMAYRAKAALEPILAARATRQQRARGMEMQYPDPEKYPLRNQVGP